MKTHSQSEKEGSLHCSNGKEDEVNERQGIACSRVAIRLCWTTAIAEADKGQT
jgi:hypothetical protein